MYVIKIIILIVSITTMLLAGDEDRIAIVKYVAPHPQSIIINNFQATGCSTITETQIAALPGGNPANLAVFKYPAAGMQFSYGTKINDAVYDDVHIQPVNEWMPVSAALVYPVFNVVAGLGFQKRYSEELDLGAIVLTTLDDMDGSAGQTIIPDFSTEVYSYSAISGYAIQRVFSENDRLAIGLQFTMDQIRYSEKLDRIEAKIDDFAYSFKGGLIYDSSPLASFGILYEINLQKKGNIDFEGEALLEKPPAEPGRIVYNNAGNNYPYVFKFPDRISFGASIHPLDNFSLNFGLTHTFWDQVHDNYKNKWDVSISTLYALKNQFGLTLGMLTSNFGYGRYVHMNGSQNAIFLSGGMWLSVFGQSLTFEVLDSHLFSDDSRKQTIIKTGINFVFH